ncbi:MAG TPA: hypothetical protein VIO58_08005 [Candidatus Methanoperedens sp.]
MKLWMTLYAMIWITLIEFLLAMTPGSSSVLIYLHVILGIAIVGLAFYNFSGIRNTRVPGRVKRISQASLNISIMVAILGALIFLDVGSLWFIPVINVSIYGLILFFHVFSSFAIITQAAAVAIAHDMWEDKEFAEETEPGVVPPMPMPQKDA